VSEIIIAVDPGDTHSGYAVYHGGDLVATGHWADPHLALRKTPQYRCNVCVLEDYYLGVGGKRRDIKKFLFSWHDLYFTMDTESDELVIVHPNTWRAYWGIRGKDKYTQGLDVLPPKEYAYVTHEDAVDDKEESEHQVDAILMARWYIETGGRKGMKHPSLKGSRS
jgi:hypothetical protein